MALYNCKPLVSVVIPAYNVEKYLGECLRSITHQTLMSLEIIIVNDGSTDNTLSVAQSFAEKNDNIIVVDKDNGGIVSARKAGIRAASADYIGFVDGDDWIDEQMYEVLYNLMTEENVDMVGTGLNFYYGEGRVTLVSNHVGEGLFDKERIRREVYPRLIFGPDAFMASMGIKLFKKALLEQVVESIDDGITYAEDVAIAYSYISRCSSMYVLEKSFYYYRQHSESVCQRKSDDILSQVEKVIMCIRKEYMMNPDADILLKYFNSLLKELLIYAYGFLSRNPPQTYIFPYSSVKRGSAIVLYCAGEVGNSYYNQLSRNHYCRIVLWVDRNYQKLEHLGVCAPSAIKDAICDYIVIAVRDEKEREIIKAKLIKKYGIPEKKIISEETVRLTEVIR